MHGTERGLSCESGVSVSLLDFLTKTILVQVVVTSCCPLEKFAKVSTVVFSTLTAFFFNNEGFLFNQVCHRFHYENVVRNWWITKASYKSE